MTSLPIDTTQPNVTAFDHPRFEVLLDQVRAAAPLNDLDRQLPHDLIKAVAQTGFSGLRLPASHGGSGFSLRQVLTLVIKVGAADPNVAQAFRNHFVFVERVLLGHLADPRRQAWIKGIGQGDIATLAATETTRKQTGGVSAFDTVLQATPQGYRLNGTKHYTTGALYSDWLFVRVSDSDSKIISVVLPASRAGIERLDDWDGMGQRLSASGTTIFRDVEVHPDEILTPGDLHPLAITFTSTLAQLLLTAINAGIAEAALEEAVSLVRSRKRTFYYAPSELAADDPILHEHTGDLAARAFAARQVVLAAADALDAAAAAVLSGGDATAQCAEAARQAAMAKVIVDPIAIGAGSNLYDLGGASSTLRSKNFDRHWRNARTLSSHNPASYKAAAIGALEINGTPLPTQGFF